MKKQLSQPMSSGENAIFEIIVVVLTAGILITGFISAL